MCRAEVVSGELKALKDISDEAISEQRSVEGEVLFQACAKKVPECSSTDAIRKEIGKRMKETIERTVWTAVYEATFTPNFYDALQLEVKMAGRKLGKEGDLGRVTLEDLKESIMFYLNGVLKQGSECGFVKHLNEEEARKQVERMKKSEDFYADLPYA